MAEHNWAGNVEFRSPLIDRPGTIDDLRRLVTGTRSARVVGTRHSFNDIADGATMISLAALPDDVVVDHAASTVSVNPAITYGRLTAHLHAHRVALHNLASLPHISVAGAVVTGTHGSGDRSGNLATAVSAIDILRSDGENVHLQRSDPEFDGAVVNLGALGAVVRITLDVEPEYRVAQTVYERLEWEVLASNFDALTAAGDSVSLFTTYGADVEQVWVKRRLSENDPDGTWPPDMFGARPAPVDLHPVAGMSAESCTPQLGAAGLWSDRVPHFKLDFTPSTGDELQSEIFVAREDAVDAIELLRGLAGELAPQLLISEVRTIAADSLWMSPHYGRASVGFHFTWRRHPPDVARLVERIETTLAGLAPRPHWGKLFSIDAATLAQRYARLGDFVGVVARFDPRGTFRNAWLERVLGG